VRLEWITVDGVTPPEPQVPPLSVRVDGIEEGDDPRGQVRFSVTVANSAAFAVDPWLTAVFRRADGAPVGGALLFQDLGGAARGVVSGVPGVEAGRAGWGGPVADGVRADLVASRGR
jgi:hypothetical protein